MFKFSVVTQGGVDTVGAAKLEGGDSQSFSDLEVLVILVVVVGVVVTIVGIS